MKNRALHSLVLFFVFIMGQPTYLYCQFVGIGTVNPFFTLDVNGPIHTNNAYYIDGRRVLDVDALNTFVGSNAGLFYTTLNGPNTAVGAGSLERTNTGTKNCAIGSSALANNSSGNGNTAVGDVALTSTTVSSNNTVVGYAAGTSFNYGWNNTFIGTLAKGSFNDQFNSIAIGNLATSTDNSRVRIGNSSNFSYEAFANWTNISDGLYKRNVKENVAGLNFILKLRPVTYQFDVTELSKKFKEDNTDIEGKSMQRAIHEKEEMVWTGFIAQEVEKASLETGFNFSGVDKPRNEYGVYGLRYAEFVVPLVKAVQEQQQQIEELKNTNTEQQKIIDALLKRMEKIELILPAQTKL